jgi:hypothetical protein
MSTLANRSLPSTFTGSIACPLALQASRYLDAERLGLQQLDGEAIELEEPLPAFAKSDSSGGLLAAKDLDLLGRLQALHKARIVKKLKHKICKQTRQKSVHMRAQTHTTSMVSPYWVKDPFWDTCLVAIRINAFLCI